MRISSEKLMLSNSHMPSCMIMTKDVVPMENLKNYVFIDERHRHKRMKLLRACERCRRRKIKCDAATTNTWPCSACKRLKICCIPPTLRYDQESLVTTGHRDPELERKTCYGEDVSEGCQTQLACFRQFREKNSYVSPEYNDHYDQFSSEYYQEPYLDYNQSIYLNGNLQYYPQQQFYCSPLPLTHPVSRQVSTDILEKPDCKTSDLSDLLGELMIGENGTAPYLSKKVQNRTSLEEPAFGDVEEYSDILPPSIYGPDLQVRIPPELMPDDETCQHYFRIYFENIHQYVPVLNKYLFYQQWLTDRESISPLILEVIFALACQLSGKTSRSNQWLALFSKHSNSFLDRPRLSTLQASLICLKGREATPKRGYYYRSWMTIVHCIEMARDLGLDEHFANHKAGKSCGSEHNLCVLKSRIWQTVFVCEMMIGTPQGRTVLSVDIESVDFDIPNVIIEDDETEPYISRNFAYIAIICRNIRILNYVCSRIKTNGPKWWLNPEFTLLGPLFKSWMKDLPNELQVTYPSDGSPPWLRSHFVGNLHSYYHLSILMLHRHPLKHMDPKKIDDTWRYHMSVCLHSAKCLCRLQEAILQSFGSDGILCMQRGLNFAIYCNLTCTALHLLALMSSDIQLKADARENFPRHMRILERWSGFWQMSDIKMQIASLQEVFVANSNNSHTIEILSQDVLPPPETCAQPQRDLEYFQTSNLIAPIEEMNPTTILSENQPMIWPLQMGVTDSLPDFSYLKQTIPESEVSSDSQSVDKISSSECLASISYDFK